MIIVLHGDDTLELQRAVKALEPQISTDAGMIALNASYLDGKTCSDNDLRSAVGAMPFLTERRLVVLTEPLAKATSDATRKRMQEFLSDVPETTILVLIVDDQIERGRWVKLVDTHWLRKWVDKNVPAARLQDCKLPDINRMVEWIRKEAKNQGGEFESAAAAALRDHAGNDTQLTTREIEKLLTFVNFSRPVTAEDVEMMTAQTAEVSIFNMVDALASKNTHLAINLMHRMLEDEDPFMIFGMVLRQFRLILQMRALIDEGRAGSAGQKLALRSQFQIDKITSQARGFSFQQLTEIYRNLLTIDEQIKTSQISWELAFDTFIADLGQ